MKFSASERNRTFMAPFQGNNFDWSNTEFKSKWQKDLEAGFVNEIIGDVGDLVPWPGHNVLIDQTAAPAPTHTLPVLNTIHTPPSSTIYLHSCQLQPIQGQELLSKYIKFSVI